MNNYELRTNKKKQAIVNTALELFGKHGFSNVSIKQIAGLADVSQVSIYNYFGNKQALIGECAKVITSDTVSIAREILNSDKPFNDKLLEAISCCNTQINSDLSAYITKSVQDDPVFVNSLITEINALKIEVYMEFVNLGKQEGVISLELSNDVIELYLQTLNTVGTQLESQSDQQQVVQLLLYGLLTNKKEN